MLRRDPKSVWDWRLDGAKGVTIRFYNETIYHPEQVADAQMYAWSRRAEGDHITDMNKWAKDVGKKLADKVENEQWGLTWKSKMDCETAIYNAIDLELNISVEKAMWESKKTHDLTGRHTYDNANRRP